MDNTENKGVCMACSCPCEAHKEHNHPVGKNIEHEDGGTCAHCGAKKEEGTCGCK
jgi:hypothetical protein